LTEHVFIVKSLLIKASILGICGALCIWNLIFIFHGNPVINLSKSLWKLLRAIWFLKRVNLSSKIYPFLTLKADYVGIKIICRKSLF
jgi:hypothetical protein